MKDTKVITHQMEVSKGWDGILYTPVSAGSVV